MATQIVYEGVTSGTRGTLFKDKKFWVAHRVPIRSTLIQNIESNGGSVEKLEKKADYLIADHLRTDTPAGSYSWAWIEDSVRAGKLLDAEDYLIGRPGSDSRPVGSTQQKATKTSFTKEDDRILAKWVTRHERNGHATRGNKIYHDLEAKYPHHTFHSWRDRWIKKLQGLPRPELTADELEEDATSPIRPATPPLPQASPLPAASRTSRARSGSATPSTIRSTRAKFTKEHDEVLIAHAKRSLHDGKRTSGNKVWQDLAQDFPEHTWQSWRDRWLRHIKPSIENHANNRKGTQPVTSRIENLRRATQNRIEALETARQDAQLQTPPSLRASRPNQSPLLAIMDESDVRTENENMNKDSAESDTEALQTVGEGQDPAQEDGHSADHKNIRENRSWQRRSSPSAGQSDTIPTSPTTADSQDKRSFYRDIQVYLAAQSQMDQPFAAWPTIHGRTFEIWDLWRVVKSQKVEPAERDWERIAEELGYNWVELPTVPHELRLCYEAQLAEFEAVMIRFDGYTDDDEDEEEDEVENEPGMPYGETGGPLNRGDDEVSEAAPYNSSPPKQPSLKRTFESALLSDHNYPASSRKRPKISRDSEIPSTPDHQNGTFHLRNRVSAGVSPNDMRLSTLPKSSRAAHAKRKQAVSEDDEIWDQVADLPVLPNPRRGGVEPETQDFPFDPETQNMFATQMDDIDESQDEVTPSQQLRSEASQRVNLHATPTPKYNVTSPFLIDEDNDNDSHEEPTPKPRYGKGANPLLASPNLLKAKRRSLPASFTKRPQPAATQRQSMPGSSHRTMRGSSPRQRSTPPAPARPKTKAEELAMVVEYWVSLGYTQQTARQSLEATTWEPGLAGQIMQLLKDGGPMPKNWEGVWTQRDDDTLRLIDSHEPPRDEKAEKKRKKATERLVDKHGMERIVLRRQWLATKAML